MELELAILLVVFWVVCLGGSVLMLGHYIEKDWMFPTLIAFISTLYCGFFAIIRLIDLVKLILKT